MASPKEVLQQGKETFGQVGTVGKGKAFALIDNLYDKSMYHVLYVDRINHKYFEL